MSKTNSDVNIRVLIISALLTVLLAISNTYLALKVGLLTAASIPAAILSMGLMKFLRSSTMYEHNLVQTAASSGEAVAGGIVYTIPALIVIGFWNHFPYLENVFIILLSGTLGVLFSAFIRRTLLSDKTLRFPEGHAIAEVLRLKEARVIGFKELLGGATVAAVAEFLQSTGVALTSATKFLVKGASLVGFGISFAPALVGAGFIMGVRVGLSLFLGAMVSYLIILPLISHMHIMNAMTLPAVIFSGQFAGEIRYIGVGAMLVAALITLLRLLKPLIHQVGKTVVEILQEGVVPEHEQDLSKKTIVLGSLIVAVLFYFVLIRLYDLAMIGFPSTAGVGLIIGSIIYILIMGFIVTVVCGYFSGLVGVTASPGSSVMIAGMIISTLLIHVVFNIYYYDMTPDIVVHGEAVAILIGTIIMSIACIANDTFQDLKVGQLLKANPRKQQLMLLFGVLIAAFVVPFVMQILYQAYGFVGHMPRPNMNPDTALAIPPAAVMAALTEGVFNGNIAWGQMSIGAITMVILFVLNFVLKQYQFKKLAPGVNAEISLLAVGIGMYLPLSSSTALIVGSLLALALQLRLRHHHQTRHIISQKKLLMACGLVTGATLMDVILAVPVALNPGGASLSFKIAPGMVMMLGAVIALVLISMLTSAKYKLK
jgi:putative OPT family oligopeptide transporter